MIRIHPIDIPLPRKWCELRWSQIGSPLLQEYPFVNILWGETLLILVIHLLIVTIDELRRHEICFLLSHFHNSTIDFGLEIAFKAIGNNLVSLHIPDKERLQYLLLDEQ